MKNFKLFKLLALFIVLITSIPQVKAGYIYLDPSGFTNWYNDECWFSLWNDDAKVRINTRTDLGNGLWRFNVGSYPTGHYYFQRMKNGEAETVYNQVDGNVTTSKNVMKITNWDAGSLQSFAISYYHNTNEIFFDNSVSNFTGNIYFVIGRDYTCTGSSGKYSVAYKMSPIVGTKLYHVQTTAEWKDANYYAIIASSSATISETNWGSSSLSTKGNNGYTAAYKTVYDIEGGSYLITTSAAGNGKAITISYAGANYYDLTKYNATQAAKKRDSGTTYSAITGSNAWPATLKLRGSYLKNTTDTARSTITSTAANDDESARVYGTIMTGTVTQSITSLSSSYYHEGWGTDSSPTNTNATHEYNITEETTVYAFFSKYYTLTYDKKGTTGTSTLSVTSVANYGGATSSSSKIPTGHQIVLTASPATGYRLVSPQAWYSDASCSSSLSNGTNTTYTISSLDANRGVYAKFELIPYTITYNLNGGENDEENPSGYNVTSATITLEDPTREGYTFEGWYASSTFSGSKVTSIPSGSTGNKEYWAKWTANTYEVQFNANYPSGYRFSSGSMANQDFTYDVAQSLTANAFVCEGYNFLGWSASSSATSATYTNSQSVSNLTSTDEATFNLYAVWEDNNTYYFDGGTSGTNTAWATAANWTKGAVPGSSSNVILLKPVVVPANATNTVNSVKIATEGSYTPNGGSAITAAGKLTIEPKGMLIVTNDVQNCVITNNAAASADSTRASTLHIESGATGNGALVWGETNSTPGYAQVDFYTKSHGEKNQNSSINQYIGTPFSNEQSILYQYYYSWLFKIKRTAGVLDWDLMSGDESMNEFEGYNLITAYDKGTVYQMEGILVSNKDVTLNSTSSTPRLVNVDATGADNPNNENVLANSWVAPIKIKNMSGAFGDDIEASIHIFNAGSPNDAGGVGTAGNYTAYTVGEAGVNDVIPSMQSFSVYTKGASPVLTLDYSALVYDDADDDLIKPNFAPRRSASIRETQDALKIRIEGENGWADELKIFIHDEFSNAFENGWDAHKMYGYPEAPQLYAVTTDGNMAINCVPTADNNVLGFTPGSEDNEYTFSFTYDGDEEYYLKDTKLNIETLINTEATYTFTSEAEDSDMRFIIIKRAPAVATDAETVSGDRLAVSGVQKIMHNGQLYIIRDGGIYSTDGQMVK